MPSWMNCSDRLALTCLCVASKAGSIFLSAWFVLYMLLVPLFLSVLYIGFRRWRSRPRAAVSHTDVITFHMVAVEMLNAAGSVTFVYGLFSNVGFMLDFGTALISFATNAQLLFHSLTCGERYLAVVHPMAYLRLKERGGVKNGVVALAWLLSVLSSLIILCTFQLQSFVHLALIAASVALVSFSSVLVLRVLIRPGPGEAGGARKQLNKSKKSALCTIMAVLAVLLTRMVNSLVLHVLRLLVDVDVCLWMTSTLWFSLPSSLVLPLLFLHRARARARH